MTELLQHQYLRTEFPNQNQTNGNQLKLNNTANKPTATGRPVLHYIPDHNMTDAVCKREYKQNHPYYNNENDRITHLKFR